MTRTMTCWGTSRVLRMAQQGVTSVVSTGNKKPKRGGEHPRKYGTNLRLASLLLFDRLPGVRSSVSHALADELETDEFTRP
jgi:hypothetical protein